jgi:hypothetical protein
MSSVKDRDFSGVFEFEFTPELAQEKQRDEWEATLKFENGRPGPTFDEDEEAEASILRNQETLGDQTPDDADLYGGTDEEEAKAQMDIEWADELHQFRLEAKKNRDELAALERRHSEALQRMRVESLPSSSPEYVYSRRQRNSALRVENAFLRTVEWIGFDSVKRAVREIGY